MTTSQSYFQHHQALLQALLQHCMQTLPFSSEQANEVDLELLAMLQRLSEAQQRTEDYDSDGQSLICRIVGQYSHITPAVNRDLFWYFGGDCLHYMGNEEIELYQQLDELLHDGEAVDYNEARAKVFKLH